MWSVHGKMGKQPMRKHKKTHTQYGWKKKLSSAGVAQICQYSEFYRKYYKEKYIPILYIIKININTSI